jgi:hypothetical protein
MNHFDAYRKLQEEADSVDSVSLNVPVLIRIMEVCREDIKSDEELHKFAEQIIAAKDRGTLGMKDWDSICTCSKDESVQEETVKEAYEPTELDKKVDGKQKHTVELDHHDLDKIRYFLEKPDHDTAKAQMHRVIRKHFGHLHGMEQSHF